MEMGEISSRAPIKKTPPSIPPNYVSLLQLKEWRIKEQERKQREEEERKQRLEEERSRRLEEERRRRLEEERRRRLEEERRRRLEEERRRRLEEERKRRLEEKRRRLEEERKQKGEEAGKQKPLERKQQGEKRELRRGEKQKPDHVEEFRRHVVKGKAPIGRDWRNSRGDDRRKQLNDDGNAAETRREMPGNPLVADPLFVAAVSESGQEDVKNEEAKEDGIEEKSNTSNKKKKKKKKKSGAKVGANVVNSEVRAPKSESEQKQVSREVTAVTNQTVDIGKSFEDLFINGENGRDDHRRFSGSNSSKRRGNNKNSSRDGRKMTNPMDARMVWVRKDQVDEGSCGSSALKLSYTSERSHFPDSRRRLSKGS